MIISFAGHSFVASSGAVKEAVKEQIRKNTINETHVLCFLGGYGSFDEICACACRELKRENAGIELIYITPYMSLPMQQKIKEMKAYGLYDDSIYPPIENTPKRFAISKRNAWMMASADLVIAYVNRNYGGAYQSIEVARRKGKKIINIFDFL